MKKALLISTLFLGCIANAGGTEVVNPWPWLSTIALDHKASEKLIKSLSLIDPLFEKTYRILSSECVISRSNSEVIFSGKITHEVNSKVLSFDLQQVTAKALCRSLAEAGIKPHHQTDDETIISTYQIVCNGSSSTSSCHIRIYDTSLP